MLSEKNQITWPGEYGEKKICCTDGGGGGGGGGLHIEMTMLVVIGDWLDGSGWTYVMTSANITTEGRERSLQKGS